MLKNLIIKNIVLIDEANIDFENNLCILTGETGSGKSILLDALSLAIGARSNNRLLRNGEKNGTVVATFDISNNNNCKKLLDEIGIDYENEIILRRIITEDGKSRAFINDIVVSQNFLSKIGEELVEIHGQHDQRGLLNPSFHRDILDNYGNLYNQKQIVADIFDKMKITENKYLDLLNNKENIEKEIDYLEHIINEMEKLNVQEGEEEDLADKRNLLMNKEKVLNVIESAKNSVDGQNSVVKNIVSAQSILSRSVLLGESLLEDGKNCFEEIIDSFEKSIIEFYEGMNKLDMVYENFTNDNYSIDDVEERLFAIRGLARKFNIPANAIPNFLEETKIKLKELKNKNFEIGNLEIDVKNLKDQYIKEAIKLRESRKQVAELLKEEIKNELKPLKMENTKFETEFIDLNENAWSRNGIDGVRFLVAVNKGTKLDDLAKVASGGELSRFMLALKVVLSTVKSVPTLIFDEIDTGVSGVVADAIGERLKKLGKNVQVFVITHLPQVASKGNSHFKISKQVCEDKTFTKIEKLDEQHRINEIAKMISGEVITDEALKMAEKLLSKD